MMQRPTTSGNRASLSPDFLVAQSSRKDQDSLQPRPSTANDDYWVNMRKVTSDGARAALLTMLGEEVDLQRTQNEPSAPQQRQLADTEFWPQMIQATREGARSALLTMLGEEVDLQRTQDGPSAPQQPTANTEFWVHIRQATREGARTALLTMLGDEVDLQRTNDRKPAPPRMMEKFCVKEPAMVPLLADYR